MGEADDRLDGFIPADFSFAPDAARGWRVDRMVRAQLAASLCRIFAAGRGALNIPRGASARLLRRVRRGPAPVAVMALYTDLVSAVFADDLPTAQSLLDQLLAPPPPVRRVVTLDDDLLGAGQAERFMRIISDDGAMKLAFYPLTPDALARIAPVVEAALALLDQAAPELAGEVGILLREIVLVDMRRPPTAETQIGGSSIFYLWGAGFIVFNQTPSRLELAEALAHEAAHMLLFGLSLGKKLTLNDARACYVSPLRDDQRPMEGLVHAAFVLGRLTWLMRRLQESGALTLDEAVIAQSWEARNRRDFAACAEIIDEQAGFTPVGAAAFAGAAAYMR